MFGDSLRSLSENVVNITNSTIRRFIKYVATKASHTSWLSRDCLEIRPSLGMPTSKALDKKRARIEIYIYWLQRWREILVSYSREVLFIDPAKFYF